MSWRYGWETLGAFRIRSLFKTFCSSSTGKAGMALLQGCLWLGVTWIQNPNWIRRSGCNFRFPTWNLCHICPVLFCWLIFKSHSTSWNVPSRKSAVSKAVGELHGKISWGTGAEPARMHSFTCHGIFCRGWSVQPKKILWLVGALGCHHIHILDSSVYTYSHWWTHDGATLSDCFPQDAASKTL